MAACPTVRSDNRTGIVTVFTVAGDPCQMRAGCIQLAARSFIWPFASHAARVASWKRTNFLAIFHRHADVFPGKPARCSLDKISAEWQPRPIARRSRSFISSDELAYGCPVSFNLEIMTSRTRVRQLRRSVVERFVATCALSISKYSDLKPRSPRSFVDRRRLVS